MQAAISAWGAAFGSCYENRFQRVDSVYEADSALLGENPVEPVVLFVLRRHLRSGWWKYPELLMCCLYVQKAL